MADDKEKTIAQSETIAVAQIVHMGTKLTLPEQMTVKNAIKLLERRLVYDEEVVVVSRNFEAFPWDGAVALDEVLKDTYGWSPAEAIPGLFGPQPPQLKAVEVAPGVVKQIPWGRFRIPGIDADLYSQIGEKAGRQVFALGTKVQRKYEAEVTKLYDKVAAYIGEHSIYRGQAFKLDFERMDADHGIVEPAFIDTKRIDPGQLIFSEDVLAAVETNVFTPLIRFTDAKMAKLPFKRGVLLSGPFGTGKTLTARVAAYHAVNSHITFIDCPQSQHLSDAVDFARMYQPAVIFCEDIDRSMDGDRTAEMDTILNIVDGVDSKNAQIMIVLTTNEAHKINPAMLRPGRLDAVIHVAPPDALAVQKLLRMYGKGVIDDAEDLSEVGVVLDGHIPAVIEEVVKRSKLAALKLSPVGTHKVKVTAVALVESARTMRMQLDLLYNRDPRPVIPTIDEAFRGMVDAVVVPAVSAAVQAAQYAANRSTAAQGEAHRAVQVGASIKAQLDATSEVVAKTQANAVTTVEGLKRHLSGAIPAAVK